MNVSELLTVILAELAADSHEALRNRLALPLMRNSESTKAVPTEVSHIFPSVQDLMLYVGQRYNMVMNLLQNTAAGMSKLTDVEYGTGLAALGLHIERVVKLDCWLEDASDAIPTWAMLLDV